jgi:hypothetical protein
MTTETFSKYLHTLPMNHLMATVTAQCSPRWHYTLPATSPWARCPNGHRDGRAPPPSHGCDALTATEMTLSHPTRATPNVHLTTDCKAVMVTMMATVPHIPSYGCDAQRPPHHGLQSCNGHRDGHGAPHPILQARCPNTHLKIGVTPLHTARCPVCECIPLA